MSIHILGSFKNKKKKPLHFCRGQPEDTIQGGVSKVADFLNII
jgi:hypothetical protein